MRTRYLSPIFLDILLILWTLIVSPYSKYGDDWAIIPAIIFLPTVIISHIVLLFIDKHKLRCLLYGGIHIMAIFYLWIYCLMKISKDSL